MTKLGIPKKPPSAFLAQYQLERRVLLRADKARGIPALRTGRDSSGNPVLVKIWPRDTAIDDADLHDIWRNETRELHRLAGYPGVSDYIAELRTSAYDELGYYLVLYPGQRLPLEKFLTADAIRPRPSTRSLAGRSLAWANILRLAKGLEILHLQGLLHRNLTTWAVLTSNGDVPDFQLTGFEWSMRIVGHELPSRLRTSRAIPEGRHSFVFDWMQLGHIAARLLEIPQSRLSDRAIASHDVAEHLIADEVRLVREMLQIFPTDRIDGRMVGDHIENILVRLNATQQQQQLSLTLVLPLGENGPLASAVREASGREIDIADQDAQQRFIEHDLLNPTAIASKIPGQTDRYRLLLRGERLTYSLEDFRRGRERTLSNWQLAYCSAADFRTPSSSSIIKQIPLSTGTVTCVRLLDANHVARNRTRSSTWETLRQQLMVPVDAETPERRLHKSFVLTQALDYLFAASDVFPVELISSERGVERDEEDAYAIKLRSRKDLERESLSKALGLGDPPAARLREALLGDRRGDDKATAWTLTESPALGDRSPTATEWRFEQLAEARRGEPQYRFSGDRAPSTAAKLFLIPRESVGRDSQLIRRLKSFTALSEHRELSRMLVDPRNRVISSQESVIEDAGFLELDSSKQAAFRAAMETLPLFLVQGPPGVGKTRLVRELVRQILHSEPATRLLLSAQSHAAVDHLLQEIERILPQTGSGDALVVRCAAHNRPPADLRFDISEQTKSLLGGLVQSALLSESSAPIRERVRHLAVSYGVSLPVAEGSSVPASSTAARRAIESLVMRAANLVFATTNAGDLERLIEEGNQFDWSIVEEAGKAMGGELVSPLLLSPRRLMIGDHKQLPPFGAERILRLLDAPTQVKTALAIGDPMIGRQFRDPTVDEVFGDIDVDTGAEVENFPELCAEASRNFLLFESLIETEFERQLRSSRDRNIAAALEMQHRMHPNIAALVAHVFYPGKLDTDPAASRRFSTTRCPVVSLDPTHLPSCPVVWVDMPWIQATLGMKQAECSPRYVNPDEQKAVRRVLALLRPHSQADKMPSLAILSAYSRQVDALGRMVEEGISNDLAHLSGFANVSKASNFANTVDSFQGNEADCVVVSLVRNNNHGSIHRALGFLADPRRMNVLMSRAKWRLIVVGSLAFLKSVNGLPKSEQDRREVEFLQRLLTKMQAGTPETGICVLPVRTLFTEQK